MNKDKRVKQHSHGPSLHLTKNEAASQTTIDGTQHSSPPTATMDAHEPVAKWNPAIYENMEYKKGEVRKWRRTLQENLLDRRLFKAEDMVLFHYFFMRLENYNMSTEELKYSKIRKVAKLIAILPDDEKPVCDDVYHFCERARALARKWRPIFYADQIADNGEDAVNSDDELAASLSNVSIDERD